MRGKSQINAERRGSFVEYPAEVQSAIISALYTHFIKFPNYTAFLCTCKPLYYAAHPVFLANYPLSCSPIKPGIPGVRYGLGRGDILIIVLPQDGGRYNMHLFEEDWLSGIRSGMKDLFEIRDDDDADDKSDEIEEKDKENPGNINGSDLNDTADLELSERSEHFAQYWIRKNPFAKFLRRVGKERAQKLSR